MNCTKLQELATGHALGALATGDAALLEQIAAHDPVVRAEVAALIDTVAALAREAAPGASPSPELRRRVLDRIRLTPQLRPVDIAAPGDPEGFTFRKAGPAGWRPGRQPGLRYKVLSRSRDMGYWMLLIELGPGAAIPTHDHAGSEQLYVLSGDLVTEGRTLRPGDFLHSEPGTHHRELVSPGGCMAILVEKTPTEGPAPRASR